MYWGSFQITDDQFIRILKKVEFLKVLLSIKPEFVEQIARGKKMFEYRKQIFKKKVESVIIYCTKPVGKIIGEFTFDQILVDTPQALWKRTCDKSGIIGRALYEILFG